MKIPYTLVLHEMVLSNGILMDVVAGEEVSTQSLCQQTLLYNTSSRLSGAQWASWPSMWRTPVLRDATLIELLPLVSPPNCMLH